MKDLRSGFTLIEILLIIAIIGVLAAVALPFFQGHIIRARLVEVENSMASIKSAVWAYHHDTESWPNCTTITEVQNSLGVGLGAVNRISGVTIVNGFITVTIRNVDPIVDGKTLILMPNPSGDGSTGWTWGWSADFPVHLRPRTR
ncbi:MAG: hypothetical protein A2157_05365 [Deltaproteobacteria bacterium RBG_16_47_11]|nr:MAG: hypothetical protein A2157_05365 [Deltaproteobacteria bacterium RBG_16_47_11]